MIAAERRPDQAMGTGHVETEARAFAVPVVPVATKAAKSRAPSAIAR